MKLAWAARSIRARLTGWYAIVLTAMLIVYATATYVAVRHEFLEQLDGQLHDDFETAEGLLTWMPDGRVAWVGDRHLDPDDDEVRIVYEVWSPAGERIHRSGTSAQLPPVAPGSAGVKYRYETVTANNERWRTLTAIDTHRWPLRGFESLAVRGASERSAPRNPGGPRARFAAGGGSCRHRRVHPRAPGARPNRSARFRGSDALRPSVCTSA